MAQKKRIIKRKRKLGLRTWRVTLQSLLHPNRRTKRIDRRRSRRLRRSRNGWRQHGNLQFSKIDILDVEAVWLLTFSPNATITRQRAIDYQYCPKYIKGLWDGYTNVVTFHEDDIVRAREFKLKWWSAKCL